MLKMSPRTADAVHREYAAALAELMRDLGATDHGLDQWWCRWSLLTRYGPLTVSHAGPPSVASRYGPTVHARFEDTQRAYAAGLGCNPHSGKWNHHLGVRKSAEVRPALFLVRTQLRYLLETPCRTTETI